MGPIEEQAEMFVHKQATRTKEESIQQRLAFLAEASELLASSLDYETTLVSLARLAVPRLADWCTVHILDEDGLLQQLAVEHIDSQKIAWAYELQRDYPPDPDAPTGLHNVVRTGASEIYSHITDE